MIKKLDKKTCASFFATNFGAISCKILHNLMWYRAALYLVQSTCTVKTCARKNVTHASMIVQCDLYEFLECVSGVQEWVSDEIFSEYLVTDRYNSAADLFTNHKLLSKHCQNQILPASRCQTLLQPDNPFAARSIRIILFYNKFHSLRTNPTDDFMAVTFFMKSLFIHFMDAIFIRFLKNLYHFGFIYLFLVE